MSLEFNPLRISQLMDGERIKKTLFYQRMNISASTLINWTKKEESTLKVEDLVKMCNLFQWDIGEFIYDSAKDSLPSTIDNDNLKFVTELLKSQSSEIALYERKIGELNLEHERDLNKMLNEKDQIISDLKHELEKLRIGEGGYGRMIAAEPEK